MNTVTTKQQSTESDFTQINIYILYTTVVLNSIKRYKDKSLINIDNETLSQWGWLSTGVAHEPCRNISLIFLLKPGALIP